MIRFSIKIMVDVISERLLDEKVCNKCSINYGPFLNQVNKTGLKWAININTSALSGI
jgi:hypothetical protein